MSRDLIIIFLFGFFLYKQAKYSYDLGRNSCMYEFALSSFNKDELDSNIVRSILSFYKFNNVICKVFGYIVTIFCFLCFSYFIFK